MNEAKAVPNDLEQDLTIQVEALDEPSSAPSDIEDDLVIEIEEEALSSKQAKPKEQAEEQVEEIKDLENNKQAAERKNDKKITLINKEYEVKTDIVKSQVSKLQAAGTPGQAAYYVAQGLSEHQKSKSKKEDLIQQVQQDNQNQQGNTADGIKREVDKLTDFDPFQRNSSSQR